MTQSIYQPSRRGFLRSAVAGSILMPGILHELLAQGNSDPLAPRPSHFPAKAKSVIFLFMSGGVSHVDTFDPKPKLIADHGKQVTLDHPEARNRPGYERLFLKRPNWSFAPYGQSGIEVSTLFPNLARRVDDIAMIRSMHTSHSNHYNATLGMHTGSFNFTRPSIGSWVSYGLGTLNRNLPSFLVLAPQTPYASTQVWGSDFLPGAHQGTRVVPGAEPVANLRRRVASQRQQELELEALRGLNETHQATRLPDDPASSGRPHSLLRDRLPECKPKMPAALDLSQENRGRLLRLYGLQARQHERFCLAVPGRPPSGGTRRALHRADRHRFERQLGLARRHVRPTPAWPATSIRRWPGC